MSTITVIDPCDDACNTAFVNGLGDAAHRRAVVHAPASSEGLLDEILRALDRHDDGDRAQIRLRQRYEWVTAWICAFDRLDLIIYGAWRLKTRDLHWLHNLARRPTVRLWLVSHAQGPNQAELLAIADVSWSWEQFRGYWRTRARNQRRAARRPRGQAKHGRRAIAIEPFGPRDFWPWAIPQMLLADGRATELMSAATRVTYGLRYHSANGLRLAVHLHDLFADWRAPAQRSFVLLAVKNQLFCEHKWFDWDPALTAVTVPARDDMRPPIRTADPAVAASEVVARNAPELRVGGEFRIGHDGSHVLLETGETVPIAGANRPALRAYLTVRGDPHGQRLKEPEWATESTTAPTPTHAQPIPALCQIAGLIEVRPLVVRVSDDAEPLTIGPTGKPWNCLKPGKLDYRHTAVLSHLLRCLQRNEYPREPLRGSTPDDIQVVHDLYHYGLVIDGAHGRPELEQWTRMLWRHGRVTMPSPSSIRA